MDGTLSEVYGRQKELASFNREGRRGFLSVFVTWDERRRILVADLLKDSASAKPGAAGLLRRALRALPAGHGPVSLRVDSGFYTIELLETCRRHRVEFCVSIARTDTMWSRLYSKLSARSWRPALDMHGAEVAECTYTSTCWSHEPLRLLVRRVRVAADEVSGDVRNRRRRTIPKGQMELLAQGRVGCVFSHSFLLTDKTGDAVEIERWHRQRAHIEKRINEAKNGYGLIHLPMRRLPPTECAQDLALALVAVLAAGGVVLWSELTAYAPRTRPVELGATTGFADTILVPPAGRRGSTRGLQSSGEARRADGAGRRRRTPRECHRCGCPSSRERRWVA